MMCPVEDFFLLSVFLFVCHSLHRTEASWVIFDRELTVKIGKNITVPGN